MGRLFGTDGVRGVANSELTPELAFKLGKAGAHVLSENNQSKPVVLIGKDTRISGDMLEDALSAGILAVGGNVIKVGVLPTPAVAYLVRHYNADVGVVISASHNPFEYNGIKFFNGEGFKLDDEIEDQIEDIIIRNTDVNSHITGDKLGRCLDADEDALEHYAKYGLTPEMLGQKSKPELEDGEDLYMMVGDFLDDPRNTTEADHLLISEGYISVVAHNVDSTDYEECRRLKGILG